MKKINLIILSSFILLLAGCMSNNSKIGDDNANTNTGTGNVSGKKEVVSSGDTIKVDYIGSFENGKVFDTSLEEVAKTAGLYTSGRTYAPLPFTVGAHQMIPGFEKGVVGMKVGETKKMTLAPADAYGEANPAYITGVSLKTFKEANMTPEVGQTYNFGNQMPGTVTAISGDVVTIDFNNKMAGKTLTFEVTVKEIK